MKIGTQNRRGHEAIKSAGHFANEAESVQAFGVEYIILKTSETTHNEEHQAGHFRLGAEV